MGRNIIRQETQIRPSDLYDDTLAPTEAGFETNPANIEDNLNHLRSQMYNLLKNQTGGNWWDDLNTPATLETGVQRGVNDLNTALHAVEKKRVLRSVKLLDDIGVTASAAATATLTSTAIPANNATVTIGAKVYTFQTVLIDVDGNVAIGGSQAQAMENLRRAIMLAGVAGTNYATSMTANTDVSATDTATTVQVTALAAGTQGNLIATAESSVVMSWDGPTFLTGGAGGDVEILATGELPSQTTAAVAAVTTLGTVVDPAATFGTAGLDEVAGLHALAPKNLVEIVDGATGDPILTSGVGESPAGKRIWGLLQSEFAGDGTTITDTTPNRVQISFVIANVTNDDLELVDGEEMGGKTINYAYRERIRMEDLSEGDFLNTASIDVGAGAVTPTRQLGYDNQGITPVDTTTNSYLDLEGAGLEWQIRDDLEAILFRVIEGSAGGTSKVAVEDDVDEFDVDAVVSDFLNGIKVDTGAAGTTLNIGVTANQIDSGGALDILSAAAAQLKLESGGPRLAFTDSNEPAGWSEDGIQLSDAAQTWTDFEAEFGEVGLMDAILQAASGSAIRKVHATGIGGTIAADSDISGPSNDNNIDTDLGDLSTGTFVDDYDIFFNGQYQRPGANAAANHDVYPGTSLANGQLKFEHKVKNGDEIAVFDRAG